MAYNCRVLSSPTFGDKDIAVVDGNLSLALLSSDIAWSDDVTARDNSELECDGMWSTHCCQQHILPSTAQRA